MVSYHGATLISLLYQMIYGLYNESYFDYLIYQVYIMSHTNWCHTFQYTFRYFYLLFKTFNYFLILFNTFGYILILLDILLDLFLIHLSTF